MLLWCFQGLQGIYGAGRGYWRHLALDLIAPAPLPNVYTLYYQLLLPYNSWLSGKPHACGHVNRTAKIKALLTFFGPFYVVWTTYQGLILRSQICGGHLAKCSKMRQRINRPRYM